MLRRVWLLFSGLLERLGIRPALYRSRHAADLPDKLKPRIVYIIGADGHDWSAVMLCPGGCGKVLEMNLLPDAHPVWTVTEQPNGLVSLHPSVWLKTGCQCHFVLRHGRVQWA